MHLGRWTRRLLIAFLVWYVLQAPAGAAATLRTLGFTALHLVEVVFAKGAQFVDGLAR